MALDFSIKLKHVEEPKTVLDDKVNALSEAFLKHFNELVRDYNRQLGTLHVYGVKAGLERMPSESAWLDDLKKKEAKVYPEHHCPICAKVHTGRWAYCTECIERHDLKEQLDSDKPF